MAKSMLEALKQANLVSPQAAARIEERQRAEDRAQETNSEIICLVRHSHDSDQDRRQQRFLNTAARETTKAGSRVGTKAYYDRFRKR